MVRGEDDRPLLRDVLAPDAAHAEVQVEERLQDRADDPVDERVHAARAGAVEESGAIHARFTACERAGYMAVRVRSRSPWPSTRAQTARGAVAGVVAAGVWAAQQPLDKRVFGVDYDDTELLGKFVTRGDAWPVVGTAMHLANGAVFGALYASIAPRMPLPSWGRGPVAALAEHVATWPLDGPDGPLHPARKDMPPLARNPRAFAQATWRHFLFGVVLGELERRLNAPKDPDVPAYEHVASRTATATSSTSSSRPEGRFSDAFASGAIRTLVRMDEVLSGTTTRSRIAEILPAPV